MSHQSELIAEDIESYLAQHENKELLRFITCGSVDDGKSTLIGRLLHDSKMIYEDQLAAVQSESERSGNAGDNVDLALLVDGLQAEREQGITIDVAYRYFSTSRRKFIIADTPGHEQYTRNMVTGASTADLAVILIDARSGVLVQTKRHSYLVSLLGIKHTVVAINKMDLVDYDQSRFDEIKADYLAFAKKLDISDVHFIPISALNGDNVVSSSEAMPWYTGKPLMESLESVSISDDYNFETLRFPVQYVNRPNLDFRGYCGTLTAGTVAPGDEITVLPSGKSSRVRSIVSYDGELNLAYPPMSVTLTLDDEIDISRGDIIVKSEQAGALKKRFNATIVWMSEGAYKFDQHYDIKIGTATIAGRINRIHHRIDVNTLEQLPAATLGLNEIAFCELSVEQAILADAYQEYRGTGSFILIDRLTNATVAAGMIIPKADTETARQVIEQSVVKQTDWEMRFAQKAGVIHIQGGSQKLRSQAVYTLEKMLFGAGRLVFTATDHQLAQIDPEGRHHLINFLLEKGALVLTDQLYPGLPRPSYAVDLGESSLNLMEHLEQAFNELEKE